MASSITPPPLRRDDYPSTGLGTKDAVDRFFRMLGQHHANLSSAINGSLTFGQNLNAEVKTVTFTTPASQWIPPTLAAGVANFDSTGAGGEIAGYWKNAQGVVEISGLVVRATTGNIFTLPAGYRPTGEIDVATTVSTAGVGAQWANIRVQPSGAVNILYNAPSTWGSIRCSFSCADLSPGVFSCFPVTVSTKISRPQLVWLAQIVDQTTSGAIAAPGNLHWKNGPGANQIQILNLPGLTLGRTYQLTLVIASG